MIKAIKNIAKAKNTQNLIAQLGGDNLPALRKRYAYRISQTVQNAIKTRVQDDPVAKQYIPTKAELKILPEEHIDPIGDEAHSPVKGIIHRYPDRVLFTPANICAVYCRYCFRREKMGKRGNTLPDILNETEIENALQYIQNRKDIWEVILTGGDPLVLAPRQLKNIMARLQAIEHIKVIRFHTRVPIADPKRVNPALIKALTQNTDQSVKSNKALYMVLHINHAQELTPPTQNALKTLGQAGISLLSQSVLLKGINNDADILATLYRELIALNVKPYYLHHPDLAPGTSHFRVDIEDGQKIMRALQGKLSGLCLPTYMLDIPGGYGKIPITPQYIQPTGRHAYELRDYKGGTHSYPPQKGQDT